MRTLDEVMEALEHRYGVEELVELLDVPVGIFLARFDDYVERKMDTIQQEIWDDEG